MKLFKSLFNFYINASVHVALAVCALVFVTCVELQLALGYKLLFFVFFATVSGYNFVKFFGLARFHHRRLAHWLKVIQVFSCLCFLFMLYFLFQLQINTLYVVFGLAVITFLYAIPFLPKHFLIDEQQNLRAISGVKIYIIAFVWSVVVVLLPVVNAGLDIDFNLLVMLLQRFLLVFVLMLPFEIRDLNYDSVKLATIPQKIGIKKTKTIGVSVLLLCLLLLFFRTNMQFLIVWSYGLVSVLVFFCLITSRQIQSKYFCSFWVESIVIFWFLFLLVFC